MYLPGCSLTASRIPGLSVRISDDLGLIASTSQKKTGFQAQFERKQNHAMLSRHAPTTSAPSDFGFPTPPFHAAHQGSIPLSRFPIGFTAMLRATAWYEPGWSLGGGQIDVVGPSDNTKKGLPKQG